MRCLHCISKLLVAVLMISLLFVLCACDATKSHSTTEEPPKADEILEQVETDKYILRSIEYNKDGNVTSDTSFTLDNDGCTSESKRIEYSYNAQGLLLSSVVFYNGAQIGEEYERFEYDDSGRILNKFRYGTLTHEYQYDETGHCIKERAVGSNELRTITYTYQNGIMATSYEEILTTIETEEGDVSICSYYFTEYDDQGNITKETGCEAEETPYVDIYHYSENSVVIKSYDLPGNLIQTITMRYDRNNRLIYKNHSHSISDYNWTNQYEYTDQSETLLHYGSDGVLQNSYYYVWDNRNNLLLEENRDASGNVTSSWRYEYDDNGQVSRLVQTINDQKSFFYGPDRKYYEDGTIKSIVIYSNTDYIAEIYFISPPRKP